MFFIMAALCLLSGVLLLVMAGKKREVRGRSAILALGIALTALGVALLWGVISGRVELPLH